MVQRLVRRCPDPRPLLSATGVAHHRPRHAPPVQHRLQARDHHGNRPAPVGDVAARTQGVTPGPRTDVPRDGDPAISPQSLVPDPRRQRAVDHGRGVLVLAEPALLRALPRKHARCDPTRSPSAAGRSSPHGDRAESYRAGVSGRGRRRGAPRLLLRARTPPRTNPEHVRRRRHRGTPRRLLGGPVRIAALVYELHGLRAQHAVPHLAVPLSPR